MVKKNRKGNYNKNTISNKKKPTHLLISYASNVETSNSISNLTFLRNTNCQMVKLT